MQGYKEGGGLVEIPVAKRVRRKSPALCKETGKGENEEFFGLFQAKVHDSRNTHANRDANRSLA